MKPDRRSGNNAKSDSVYHLVTKARSDNSKIYKTLVSTSSFSWQELKGDPARWRLIGIKRLATNA
jgi:hypothetical protein